MGTSDSLTPIFGQRKRNLGFISRVLFIASGALALLWFLIRVIPKPSRASYPCQRAAFPVACSFILWLAGIVGTVLAFRGVRRNLRRARYAVALLGIAGGTAAALWTICVPLEQAPAAWTPQEQPNQPMGIGKGIHPGRVVWDYDPAATSWDGTSSYWWSSRFTNQTVVDAMLSRCLRALSGEATDGGAWNAIFRHFNQTHGRGDVGYTAGEGIAIKINQNVTWWTSYDATNGPIASPQMVDAILRQLVQGAGVAERDISVYDASRAISHPIYDLCHGDFPGVSFVDNLGQSGRVAAVRDDSVPVYYSGAGVDGSGTTRLPTCVVRSPYLINMGELRGHEIAGVTLCAKNYFGSIWRPGGGFSPSNLHTTVAQQRPRGSYSCLVDLIGHKHLGGKTLLFIIDAIYGAQHPMASPPPARWQMSPFNNHWTSSLFVSQDLVAIDSVGLDFCRNEPTLTSYLTGVGAENYLHEAALADNPPSGTVYDPNRDGTALGSLGVHEHWNDVVHKQYTRNLGTGEGIELIPVHERSPVPSLTVDVESGQAPATVCVDGSASSSPTGSVVGWAWSFGDGAEATGATPPCHVFEKAGLYPISLTVTNDTGFSQTAVRSVTVTCPSGDIAPRSAADIGSPAFSGSSWADGDCLSLCAGGSLLTGTSDKLHFAYEEVSGDFDRTLRIEAMEGNSTSQTGLMVRSGLEPGAIMAAVGVARGSTSSSFFLDLRTRSGGTITSKSLGEVGLPAWAHIAHAGTQAIASVSRDGVAWTEAGRLTFTTPPEDLLVGAFGIGQEPTGNAAFEPLRGRLCFEVPPPPVPFRRGDANADGSTDLGDAIAILFKLFGGETLTCLKTADTNNEGAIDLSDVVFLLSYLFLGGKTPDIPFGSCGTDPIPDELACESYSICQ
jgi:PKD repeat protein